ncbi:FAD-binding oxidoreductase [Xanthovirga aplysinae]|uniref:FAD-binding oxidoreductase n=1 Tax=Xanthovirga aplysinae TaxID=2529853 RepID=UPI0012BD2912|nr:FAD-binding oxidoreductase [Xanthovirga aplysinae]MTI33108.1 FAD-binding oxidoreductase [Xanthovirga aplysinae]
MPQLIKKIDGSFKQIAEEEFEAFKQKLRSQILCEGDNGYDEARSIFNHMIQRKPAVIIKANEVFDIQHVVKFVKEHQLLLSIKAGGHNVSGNAICECGILLDLSLLQEVQVDFSTQIVHAQAGVLLGRLDHETQKYGLAVPMGVISKTGMAGLTLGGGFGWLRTKYGLSVDCLLSVELVTAEGSLITANEKENPDLFWAIRGGGGNFGVVTSFCFQLNPVGPKLLFMAAIYSVERAKSIINFWRDFSIKANDNFSSKLDLFRVPAGSYYPSSLIGNDVIMISGIYLGPIEEAEQYMTPLRSQEGLLADKSKIMLYEDIQQVFDLIALEKNLSSYFKSLYVDQLNEEVIDLFLASFHKRPIYYAPYVIMDLRGAMCRVPHDATAFGQRSPSYLLEFNLSWTDLGKTEEYLSWIRGQWKNFLPFSSSQGLYLNHSGLQEEGETLVKNTFGKNYPRLQKIKKKYDPLNLFRMNSNVLPAK